MRRLALLVALAVAAGGAVASSGGPGAEAGSTYRVDAVFDTAKGIIPGQLVKIAGARVGTVRDVTLTGDYKARIHMEVERRFAPFRTDATCSIQPEGLLSENFVQCDPGTPAGRALRARGDRAPTVPLARTTVPVSLNDLFDVWSVPTRERLRVLVNQLGIGTAGRGEDLNQLLRRANPSLTLARRAIGTLNRQRAQLATIVDSTDRVVGELAARRDRVQAFVEAAARAGSQTAAHAGPLAEGIRRLPPLLAAARPALTRLDELAAAGTPLLRQLRAAAPEVDRLVARLEPFARAGLPAVRGLEPALRAARRAVRASRPLQAEIRRFTRRARPLAPVLSALFVDTRDSGFVESTLKFSYYAASAAARFDRISHILPAHILFNPCAQYAREPMTGCAARYAGFAPSRVTSKAPPRRRARQPVPPTAPGGPAAPAPDAPGQPRPPAAPRPAPAPSVESLVDDVVQSIAPPDPGRQALEDLAAFLLR